MYYRSGTGGRCCIRRQTFHVNSPGGGTFPCEITSRLPSWNYDVKLKTMGRTTCQISPQSDLKWCKGALGLLREVTPTRKKKNDNSKMGSDMRSVPDLNIFTTTIPSMNRSITSPRLTRGLSDNDDDDDELMTQQKSAVMTSFYTRLTIFWRYQLEGRC